jgi:hypothetical protein
VPLPTHGVPAALCSGICVQKVSSSPFHTRNIAQIRLYYTPQLGVELVCDLLDEALKGAFGNDEASRALHPLNFLSARVCVHVYVCVYKCVRVHA